MAPQYKIVYCTGGEEHAQDWRAAVERVLELWPSAVISGVSRSGYAPARALVWASEEDAGPPGLGDDGTSAVAEILELVS